MLDLEKFKFTDGKTNLSAEEFNARFYALVRRIHTLEQVRMDWEGAITEIQNAGVARIDGAVQPLVEDLLAAFESQQSGWQALMADAEPQVQTWGQEHNPDGTHGDVSLANSADFMTEHQADGRHKAADFDLSGSAHFRTSHNADGSMFLPAFLHGLKLSVNAADEIAIDAGCLDLSGKVFRLEAQAVKTVSGLAANTTYHLYALPPTSGLILSTSEILIDVLAPTYDPARGAGYQGDGRWLGWMETDSAGALSAIESVREFNAVSVGTVELFLVRETPPFGWIEFDGSEIVRATYADFISGVPKSIGLAFGPGDGATTANLPDLRGRFFRVWAHGSVNDPDRASRTNRGDGTTGDHPGTRQTSALISHNHSVTGGVRKYSTGGPNNWIADGLSNLATENWSVNLTGGNETRPLNINLAIFGKFIGRL